jgi:two-component system, OmpR family, response regulator
MTIEGDAANKSKVIIGVDDTPENLTLLGHVVAAAGYTFFSAPGGAECLALLSRIEPKLILLDIQMPGMDGFETCRQIRREARLRHVPVAFLTSRKTTEDVRAGVAAGGNDFILKPFDNAQLIGRVNHWTRQQIGKA